MGLFLSRREILISCKQKVKNFTKNQDIIKFEHSILKKYENLFKHF